MTGYIQSVTLPVAGPPSDVGEPAEPQAVSVKAAVTTAAVAKAVRCILRVNMVATFG
ncbi:hypothetical protein D3C85_1855100 [compost metagenome]